MDLIRGRSAEEAVNILTFSPKKSAAVVLKVLRSAIANASHKDKEAEADKLIIKKAYVGQGPRLKRYYSRAQGRADQIQHRTSHFFIVLGAKGT
jgi:large subunit ribosomal protein L22